MSSYKDYAVQARKGLINLIQARRALTDLLTEGGLRDIRDEFMAGALSDDDLDMLLKLRVLLCEKGVYEMPERYTGQDDIYETVEEYCQRIADTYGPVLRPGPVEICWTESTYKSIVVDAGRFQGMVDAYGVDRTIFLLDRELSEDFKVRHGKTTRRHVTYDQSQFDEVDKE